MTPCTSTVANSFIMIPKFDVEWLIQSYYWDIKNHKLSLKPRFTYCKESGYFISKESFEKLFNVCNQELPA